VHAARDGAADAQVDVAALAWRDEVVSGYCDAGQFADIEPAGG